jgi:hypothetical protein
MKYYLVMEDFLYPEPPSTTQADAEKRLKALESRRAHAGKVAIVPARSPEEAARKAVAWWKAQKK